MAGIRYTVPAGGAMHGDLMSGLAGVLSMVGMAPHPDDLAAGLVNHLAEPMGVAASAILVAFPPTMAILGLHGYSIAEVEGLDAIPLDRTYPVPRAYLDGEILIEETAQMPTRYAGMRRLGGRTRLVMDRIPGSFTVSVPIVSMGRPVGGYSVLSTKADWSTLDISVLDTIGHALGMWLTHPDSGLPTEPDHGLSRLTTRQVGILSKAASGMSNTAIALALGVSESTVKQEFGRMARTLDADDRRTAIARAVRLGILEDRRR